MARQNRPHKSWLRCAICLLIVSSGLFSAVPAAHAQISSSEEYRLKLAFLYNFAKFTEWPPEAFPAAQAPLNICIVGKDPFDRDIEQRVGERTVNGHPCVSRTVRPADNLSACHIVFLRSDTEKYLPAILDRLAGSNTITVGESASFARRGGIINFLVEGKNLRFEINLGASQRVRPRISSRLLSLARIVNPP